MPDFSSAQIRSVYIDKCKNPFFANNLRKPTDARIKKECIALFKKKNNLSDKQVLRDFLQLPDDIDVGLSLKKMGADKFKPIVQFMKNITQDPRDETIELVAWLINFDNELIDNPQQPSKQKELENDSDNERGSNNENTKNKDVGSNIEPISPLKGRIILISCIILLVLGGTGAFLFWKDKIDRATITKDEKCMYWTGDHYEAVACDQETSTSKIPLNIKLLNRLQQITLSDTLTKKDLGKTWYTKINKEVQFFTDSGMHPVDSVKRLRPLTGYILSNYVSYDRYILKILIWSISIAVFALLFILIVYKYLSFRKSPQ